MLRYKNDIGPRVKTPFVSVIVVPPADSFNLVTGSVPALLLSTETNISFRAEMDKLTSGSSMFLVCWDERDYHEELGELMLHALFSPNYLFVENRPVVIIRKQSAQFGSDQLITVLSEAVISQGFEGVEIWTERGNEQVINQQRQPRFISDETALTDDWVQQHLFTDLRSLTGYLVIDTNNISGSYEIQEHLADLTRSFLSNQPMIAASVKEYMEMKDMFSNTVAENKQLRERLAGAEKTIGVIRTKYKDDYENLFKWYHNEYEILPLWYKRFGHVLKVLMGKRSFKSLFSDDVKKYKD